MGQVQMRHPYRDDVVTVNERAFDAVWVHKGWELVNPYTEVDTTEVNTDPEGTRLPVLNTIEESELRAMARELGIDGAEDLTANELRSLLDDAPEFYDAEFSAEHGTVIEDEPVEESVDEEE